MEQAIDNHRQQNRRQYSLRTLVMQLYRPRRSTARRSADRRYPVTDVFDSGLLSLGLLLILFSSLDAVFTLTLIHHGGSELNPVMNYFLGLGKVAFLTTKLVLTIIPTVILVAVGNVVFFRKVRGRTLLAALVGLYAGIVVYELALLTLI